MLASLSFLFKLLPCCPAGLHARFACMQNWVPRQGRTEPPQQQQRASEHTDHVHPSMAMVATAATVCVASPSSLFSAGASSRECGRRGSSSRVQGVRPSISSRVQGAPLVRQSPLRLSISSRRRSREWRWQVCELFPSLRRCPQLSNFFSPFRNRFFCLFWCECCTAVFSELLS